MEKSRAALAQFFLGMLGGGLRAAGVGMASALMAACLVFQNKRHERLFNLLPNRVSDGSGGGGGAVNNMYAPLDGRGWEVVRRHIDKDQVHEPQFWRWALLQALEQDRPTDVVFVLDALKRQANQPTVSSIRTEAVLRGVALRRSTGVVLTLAKGDKAAKHAALVAGAAHGAEDLVRSLLLTGPFAPANLLEALAATVWFGVDKHNPVQELLWGLPSVRSAAASVTGVASACAGCR